MVTASENESDLSVSASPRIHYTFKNVNGKTVADDSGSGYDAKLVSSATVREMGKYNVLDLGNGSGYLDMTTNAGEVIKDLGSFTISSYYRVDRDASLSGNGYFLWAFSKLAANTSSADPYIAYRLNAQHFSISTGGYSNEKEIQAGAESEKNVWKHVLYRQTGNIGELYIDGILIGSRAMPVVNTLFSENTPYNWIGRAPFNGDSYLKNTLVSDFRLYDVALSDDDIMNLASVIPDLENEYRYGTAGDFSALSEKIENGKQLVASAESRGWPVNAVAEFNDALISAIEIIESGIASQFLIDDQIESLKKAEEKLISLDGFEFEPVPVYVGYDTDRGFRHPGTLHTDEDFERVKALIAAKDPTVLAAYEKLKANEYSQSTVTTWPVERIVRGGGVGENYMNAARGAAMAYQNALRWKLSGDKAHADRAVYVLNAWASICKEVGGDTNQSLASGLYGYGFASAAELMRDYEGWNPEDFAAFKKWILDIWYPRCIDFLRRRHGTWLNEANTGGQRPGHYWSNWGLCNVLAVMSFGILCDDVFIYNQGVSYYKYDQVGTFTEKRNSPIVNDGLTEFLGNLVPDIHEDERGPYGMLGQMQESGRDQGHALMALGLAADICQIGWNQGDDLYGYMDNRIAAGAEHVAAYNHAWLEVEDLPWTEYWYHDCRTAIHNSWKMGGMNGGGRGGHRPFWDRIIGHFEGIKGVKMTYSREGKAAVGIDGGGGNYSQTSGGFDHLGFTTLMDYRPSMATADEVPTQIIPYITYEGKTYRQSELGGIKNTYEHLPTSAIPVNSTVKFSPSLPEGTVDTGIWEWSTGEKTKDIEMTFDRSRIITVTYTNDKGVKSRKMFSIAVAGDCIAETLVPNVYFDGISRDDSVITIPRGSDFILTAWSKSGWGYYRWDNGGTDYRITVNNLRNDRSYSVIYTNQGGRETKQTFHVKVVDILPGVEIGGEDAGYNNTVIVAKNKAVTLKPAISPEIRGGSWLWSNGETTQNLEIPKVTGTESYTVKYIYGNIEYNLTYNVYVTVANKTIEDGDYVIKDIEKNTYLTNDGSDKPKFKGRVEGNDIQTWRIMKDGSRYKITSVYDDRYINAAGDFGTEDYHRLYYTYSLYGVEDGDMYSIKNGGSSGTDYWDINENGTINGNASSSINGYPFEIVKVETILGINGIKDENLISVYPTAVTDEINIVSLSASDTKASVFSANGSLVKVMECKTGINSYSVSDLPQGLYFVVIPSDGTTQSIKIIKK